MAQGKCEFCGVEEYMPFVCKFCKGRYCVSHRLPENHTCTGLEGYRDRLRQEGRMFAPEAEVVAPRVTPAARVGALFDRLQGRAAQVYLGVMVGVFLLQVALRLFGLRWVEDALFILDRRFYFEPWTIFTSVFAHNDLTHLFFNALVFFFFAPSLENLIGSRRFSYLFIGGGALAGLLQVVVFSYVMPAAYPGLVSPNIGVLGASGGVLALLGTLTILAPKLTVLVMFVIPAPLWLITAAYAIIDLLGLFGASDGIAHLAHLGGLAVGLVYGNKLHKQGLRVQVLQRPAMHRRHH